MCNLSMQQCSLYCYCNVGTNRMQSDESLLSKAMLRCSLTSLLQCQCKPNAERWELALKSYAEVQPDFAIAMSVQTECRTWKLVFKSYAEVQPDFAIAKIQRAHPEIQIFSSPNIAPRKVFHTLKSASNPISTGTSAHFPHAKKMK